MPGDDGAVESRNCSCGLPAVNFTVKKEGANQGRVFFKCGKQPSEQPCKFFEWADEPAGAARSLGSGPSGGGGSLPEGPPCTCNVASVQLTVRKEGPNQGRTFFKCNNNGSCNYFQWADEEPAPPGLPCNCGVPSSQRKVQKEGPNKGRLFMVCVRKACDFFAWADEEAPDTGKGGAVPTPVRSGGGKGKGGTDVCFKCQQPGHWASNCPNQQADGGYGKGGKGSGRGGRGSRGGRGKKSGGFPGDDDFGGGFPGDAGERYQPYGGGGF